MNEAYRKGFDDCNKNIARNYNPYDAEKQHESWQDYNKGFNKRFTEISNELTHSEYMERLERDRIKAEMGDSGQLIIDDWCEGRR